MSEPEKKIIIDEDWKSQVQAEKEAAGQPDESPAAGDPTASVEGETDFPEDPQMPQASFEMLLTGLATEAMMSLGQIPHPVTGEASVRLNQAKYLIDTIEVLEEKTKGNITPEESQATQSLLHQLRMAFIAVQGQPPQA